MNAHFRFLPDLNTFLPPNRQQSEFDYTFENGQSVKHLIEAAGIPHTEVGQIEVNGQPVGFTYHVQQGDQVTVSPATAATGPQPAELRFVLDNHLGRLAAYLRMLGFDSLYRNDYQDEELAEIAARQARILLTRDRRLLMRRTVQYGYCLRSLDSRQQLSEIVKRFDLTAKTVPFQRCLRCNHPLQPVAKQHILHRLEPLTQQYFEEFHICPHCEQIYWKGSHYDHMQDIIEQVWKL